MKRDWDIVRQILIKTEELGDTRSRLSSRELPPYDDETVSYHMFILMEARLVEGHAAHSSAGITNAWTTRLTWDGHEFIDRIREPGVWNQVKSTARSRGLTLTFEMIKQIATKVIADLLTGG